MNFSGQYNHLILRRVRELGFTGDFVDLNEPVNQIIERFRCLIISGGPWNVPEDLPRLGNAQRLILEFPGPVLGICLGHQLMAYTYGGELARVNPEFGGVRIMVDDEDTLFRGLPREFKVWESHNISVIRAPSGFRVIAHSDRVPVEAMVNEDIRRFGVQFHPEVSHTEYGREILRNFLNLCH